MKKIKLLVLSLGILLFSQANATIPCAGNYETMDLFSSAPIYAMDSGNYYGQTIIPSQSGTVQSISFYALVPQSTEYQAFLYDLTTNTPIAGTGSTIESEGAQSITINFNESIEEGPSLISMQAGHTIIFVFSFSTNGVVVFGASNTTPGNFSNAPSPEDITPIEDYDMYMNVCYSAISSGVPTIQLSAQSCDRVMQSRDESIVAEEVSGAGSYRFKIFDMFDNLVVEKIQSSKSLEYKNITQYVTPATYYYVQVSAKVGSEWGELGYPCQIKTPGADQGTIQNCGQTYTSWNQVVKADVQEGADRYQFIFNNGGGNIVYASSRPYVKLRNVNLTGNSTYSVKVRIRKNGVFGQATEDCSITTPSGSPTREGDAFVNAESEIFMFPNPAEGDYVYLTNTIHNVEIFDAIGNLVSSQAQADLINVSELAAGMYIVKSDEGLVKLMVK